MNKRVKEVVQNRFHEMLDEGKFQKVRWSRTLNSYSYGMFEYSEYWSRFARLVDKRLKDIGEEGVFTKKYNKVLLAKIEDICANITEEEVLAHPERFKTWMD
jgi:hypothetical protein